jgi:hypothetical protein
VVWEARGFVAGETRTLLQPQRHVAVMVPLKATRVSSHEAVQWADRQDTGPPHPSREQQPIAFVHGGAPLWEACQVPRKAGVLRSGHRQKAAVDFLVLVTTDRRLPGPGMVRHYAERPAIDQDDAHMKSGGWQRKQRSATRDSALVFSVLTGGLSSRLSQLCAHTPAGAHCADKPRQALACDQLRSRRTPIMAYAGGHCDIFETLSFVRCVLQLPAAVQERLRHWLDQHLHAVIQRE